MQTRNRLSYISYLDLHDRLNKTTSTLNDQLEKKNKREQELSERLDKLFDQEMKYKHYLDQFEEKNL